MKTKKFIATILIVLSIGFIYTGRRKNDREQQTDTSTARDNAEAQSVFSGIWKQIAEATDSSNVLRSSCASTTIVPYDTVTWPKTLTIDFGTTNCLCTDGNYRKGIITAVFSGPYRDSTTVITVTLTNYYHNDNLIQGTQTITNKGHNTSNNLVYNVVVNNATYTTSNGNMSWSTNQNREWIAGENTSSNLLDDVYLITGTANGRGINGNAYTIAINSPLRAELNCQWIVSGSFTVSPQNYPSIVFDYGSGTCDNQATAVLNAKTYTITLY